MKCLYCDSKEWHNTEPCRVKYLKTIGVNPDNITPKETESAMMQGIERANEAGCRLALKGFKSILYESI
jgi:hypothetical protein